MPALIIQTNVAIMNSINRIIRKRLVRTKGNDLSY